MVGGGMETRSLNILRRPLVRLHPDIPTCSHQFLDQYLSYDDLNVVNDYQFPPQYANLTKNSSIPAVAGGVLWQDEVNKVFWLYGGEFASAPSKFALWGYDVILNQWYDIFSAFGNI